MRNGKGVWKAIGNNNINVYVGEWKNNRAEGYGTYTWPYGIYLYQYQNKNREIYLNIGDRYEGEWLAS